MNTRRFAIGFVIIFATLALFVWLEVTASRGQREINRIQAEETAVARAGFETLTAEIILSATSTSTPSITPRRPFNTFTPSPTFTISGTLTGTLTLTPTLFPTIAVTTGLFTPSPSATISQTATITPGPSPTDTPKPTETGTTAPTPTSTTLVPMAFDLNGRLLWDGAPIENVAITLERIPRTEDPLTTTLTLADGTFEVEDVFPLPRGIEVVFENTDVQGLPTDQVMAEVWLGVIEYSGEDEIDLPDMEIGNGTFDFEFPSPGGEYSITNLSATNPLEFDWTPYTDDSDVEIDYFVEIIDDLTNPETVWQSEPDPASSVDWDGITNENNTIDPGDYYWGVGAIIQLEDGYELTIMSRPVLLKLTE